MYGRWLSALFCGLRAAIPYVGRLSCPCHVFPYHVFKCFHCKCSPINYSLVECFQVCSSSATRRQVRLDMQGAVQAFADSLLDWWSAAHLADICYRGRCATPCCRQRKAGRDCNLIRQVRYALLSHAEEQTAIAIAIAAMAISLHLYRCATRCSQQRPVLLLGLSCAAMSATALPRWPRLRLGAGSQGQWVMMARPGAELASESVSDSVSHPS